MFSPFDEALSSPRKSLREVAVTLLDGFLTMRGGVWLANRLVTNSSRGTFEIGTLTTPANALGVAARYARIVALKIMVSFALCMDKSSYCYDLRWLDGFIVAVLVFLR